MGATSLSPPDLSAQLTQLKSLLDAGALTQDDFEEAKRKH